MEFIATKSYFVAASSFCALLWPNPAALMRTGFAAFFPRISAKRSECCRPSAVADRSTFPPPMPQAHPHTAGRLFFSDQRRAQPGKNAFPSRRFAGMKFIATKNTKMHESCSGASLIGGNARSSPPPRPFQLLGVLGELGVGRFHAKGAKPAKGSLGRSPFCGFSWQFQVARHRLRV